MRPFINKYKINMSFESCETGKVLYFTISDYPQY